LRIQVELVGRNKTATTEALIDSGATGNLISHEYAIKKQMNLRKLARPIPVHNVNDTENTNGEIGYYRLVLLKHNPEIDWRSYVLDFTRCPDTCN
ncbi:hypothetical protein JAAARDRAFT_109703, partial [Jaapia argillacea MUCL 33604]